MKLRPKEPKT